MHIAPWVWLPTSGGLIAIILADLYMVSRRPHRPSFRECLIWVGVYLSLAVVFGLVLWGFAGGTFGGQFFAGWITEYSLSADNLFVTMLIMTSFRVPERYQQKTLAIGIIIALILRVLVVGAGTAAITAFGWLFYIFGAFLLYTAIQLAISGGDDDDEFKENFLLRWAKKILPATEKYNGSKLTTKIDGKRLVTPMLIVMIAIGTTNLIFAVDSIPAIFGLTKEPFIILTANAFALMGLRQLYFIIGGLLDRLVFLNYGLAFVLGFIGVKLVTETLHHDGVAWSPAISTTASLITIAVALVLTAVVSLAYTKITGRGGKSPDASAGDATDGAEGTAATDGPAATEAASSPPQ